MERRDFFLKTAAVGAMAGLTHVFEGALAADKKKKPDAKGADSSGSAAKLKNIADKAADCVEAGEACLGHCLRLMANGDTSVKDCALAVSNMLAACKATLSVASYASAPNDLLKAQFTACAKFCRKCAEECKMHSNHHAECKKCLESCEACAKACEEFV